MLVNDQHCIHDVQTYQKSGIKYNEPNMYFLPKKLVSQEMFKLPSVNLMQGFWKFNQRQESKMQLQFGD
jgi:hypothetical protein